MRARDNYRCMVRVPRVDETIPTHIAQSHNTAYLPRYRAQKHKAISMK